ncbi:spore coat U domain-containing protein [Rosenbergiella australiborealis]|uniref:Csu type fimbrial protein n=1 Tax=Rosenbergiella australiborealis TaxID=1544696 RepID=UPI001F4DD30B|nr:spore coat protein U domain-containing protein [Rosenbergiella australiborealis]
MRRFLVCLLLLVGINSSVFAGCTASSSTTSFGSLSSFTLASTAQLVESGSGFTCTGSALSILGTNTITATITSSTNASGSTPRLYNSSTSSYVPYTLCSDSACSSTYSIGSSVTWTSTSLIGLLGLFNASDGTLPIYLKTSSGVNVPAGTYSDTLTLTWSYKICFIGVAGVCSYTTGTATSTIAVTLIVTNDCAIDSAPDVNFGSAALPADFNSVASSLSVRCTKNASYNVKLTSSNATTGNWRQMVATTTSGTAYLQYQLQQSNGTVWTPSTSASYTGSGLDQSISYTALVNPSQNNQLAGSYSDTVTVTVTY